MKTWTITHKWNKYTYSVKEEIAFWEKAIRVICKWAKMDEIFAPEDLNLVINEIIPSYIDIRRQDNKTETLQIRIRKSEKEKLKEIAKKENLSISDLIVSKLLIKH